MRESTRFFSPWRVWLFTLGTLVIAGVIGGGIVFWKGLSVTHLTDRVPWGLWITIDLSSIALSAGAFTLCAVVHILGQKRFQPIARTAVFIGLIGYSMAVLTLLLDIGRPDRFWHALVYWNPHSVLWEVTMCVCLYLTVLLLEVGPVVAVSPWLRARFPSLARKAMRLHRLTPYLAVVGLGLSMLHQSSLGGVYGVLKARPLWYRPGLTLLFFISAVAGGMALTVLASMLSARLTREARVNEGLLDRVAQYIGWVLAVYLYFRFWDTLAMTYTYHPGRTEGLRLLTGGTLSFNFWIGELLLGVIVPMVLLLRRRSRANPLWRMVALALVVGGVVANRWDTNLSGLLVVPSYLPGEPVVRYTMYSPSLIEWLTGLGIVAYGLLAFSLAVRYLRLVDHSLVLMEEHSTRVSRVVEESARP